MQASEAFSEVSRETLKFRGECLLGQLHGTLEPRTDPGLLLLIHVGVQADEVRRRLDGRVRDLQIEQAVERRGVVAGVEQRAKSPLCF